MVYGGTGRINGWFIVGQRMNGQFILELLMELIGN